MAASRDVGTDWTRSAGNFACTVCRRKRLPASQFSKSQASKGLKNRNMHTGFNEAKCKDCVTEAERAALKRAPPAADAASTDVNFTCSACKRLLSSTDFSGSQRTKLIRGQKGRCKECVGRAEKREKEIAEAKRVDAAKAVAARAKTSAAGAILTACAESAAEAQSVCGIRAVRGGRGRGRTRFGRKAKIEAAKARRAAAKRG